MSAEELKKLVMKRKGLRISSTKTMNALKAFLETEEKEEDKVRSKVEILQDIIVKICAMDEEVQERLLDDEEAFVADVEECQDRIELLKEIICAGQRVLKEIGEAALDERSFLNQLDQVSTPARNKAAGVKLPTMELPQFDGDPLGWLTFWDVFKASVHDRADLASSQKFSYLRGQLRGEPKQLLEGFPVADAFYEEAVALLRKTYGKVGLIIRAHIHAILDLEGPKATAKELRAYMANYECHLRALTALKVPVADAGFLLTEILIRKLPFKVKDNINRASQEDSWTLPAFRLAIEQEIYLLSESQTEKSREKSPPFKAKTPVDRKTSYSGKTFRSTAGSFNVGTITQCVFCNGGHKNSSCLKFKNPWDRYGVVRKKQRCFNCLGNHMVSKCTSENSCSKCGARHHTLLCRNPENRKEAMANKHSQQSSDSEKGERDDSADTRENQESGAGRSVSTNVASTKLVIKSNNTALPTAMLQISCAFGISCERALFDQGSQRSFIAKDTADKLKMSMLRKETLTVNGFGVKNEPKLYPVVSVPIVVYGRTRKIEALVVNELPSIINMPGLAAHIELLRDKHVQLADAYVEQDNVRISLLIGSDYYYKFVTGYSYMQHTHMLNSPMGNMVSGPIPSSNETVVPQIGTVSAYRCAVHNSFENDVTNLWDLETIGIKHQSLRTDETLALGSFRETIKYVGGQYSIGLPWKRDQPSLPNNYGLALGRLNSTLKQLRKNTDNLVKYGEVFEDHLKRGFIERVRDPFQPQAEVTHYIPHLPVWRSNSDTTPLRVVFDCSAGSPSLNDCLYSGPSLNHEMLQVLMRFRLNKYACLSDISKAYHMIALHEKDRDATRFLWPAEPKEEDSALIVYRFKVVLFGATCSQFLLNSTIQYHLGRSPSNTARCIERGIYVDNVQFTTNSEDALHQFYKESKEILSKANLHLREWVSNSAELNELLDKNNEGSQRTKLQKILGMRWDISDDYLEYPKPEEVELPEINKRTVLSTTAQIFDPLGYLAPVTILARIFIQKLWLLKYDWDTPLTEELRLEWQKIKQNCVAAQRETRLPRSLGSIRAAEMHVFADASKYAYGAVVYFLHEGALRYVLAKSRVAPVRSLTIPKLELTAATIAVRLVNYVKEAYRDEITFEKVHLWSDSQVTLGWLHTSKRLEPYVHNRVTEIKQLLPDALWHYVPTASNPADLLTKGISASTFQKSELWLKGPEWLPEPHSWPAPPVHLEPLAMHLSSSLQVQVLNNDKAIIDITRFNSLSKLYGTTVAVFKATILFKKENLPREVNLLRKAIQYWSVKVQEEIYVREREYLEGGKMGCVPNLVKQLCLFYDNGLLRCRGRLELSPSTTWEANNPVLLPSQHHFTELIIQESHCRLHHFGTSSVLSDIRQRWWFPRMRQRIKTFINKCVICRKAQGPPFRAPVQPPLPKHRLIEAPPFTITGIDYSGALNVKSSGGVRKVYIVVLTCAVTRAIHLELVEDNTCESFLRAFRRFIGRRSCPQYVYSDNSTTFTSAADYLKRLAENPTFQSFMTTRHCQWRFIPAKAPWFGGIWERLVGITKACIKKALGRALVTVDELRTLLVDVEATINDRPLTVVTGELGEDSPLTPSQLLCGHRISTLPTSELDPDAPFGEREALSVRQRLLEKIKVSFWHRWRRDYLLSLRERKNPSHKTKITIPQIGEIVLIHDEVKRPLWRLARIVKLFKGIDEHIRSALLQTENGQVTRPITKLYPLEVRVTDPTDYDINAADQLVEQRMPRPVRQAAAVARAKIAQQLT